MFNLGRVTQLSPDATGRDLGTGVDGALGATFWSILGGLLACWIGGAIGGAVTRPANADVAVTPAVAPRTEMTDDVHDEETTTRRSRAS